MVRPGSVEVVHAVFDRVVNHLLNFFFIDGSILMQRQAHTPESQSGQSLRAGFIVLHSLSPFFTHPAGTGCFLHNPYPDFAVLHQYLFYHTSAPAKKPQITIQHKRGICHQAMPGLRIEEVYNGFLKLPVTRLLIHHDMRAAFDGLQF